MTLQAPFPWFGGKSRIASRIWERLGDVSNYVEPFAGSLAVLLGRPPEHVPRAETVNDKDGFISNFWRAVQRDPEAVAYWADWPVNENDLHARHVWLVEQRADLTAKLEGDPSYCDALIAGWWVWGVGAWIGGGWCSGNGPWVAFNGGRGVHRQLVHLSNGGRGVHRKLVHLSDAGQGVHRKRGLVEWFGEIRGRLRHVRVCSGDWTRVLTSAVTGRLGPAGIFLDPPYARTERESGLYAVDVDEDVAAEVRDWAIAHGTDPQLRIALCGYDSTEMPPEWEAVRWKANGGYGNQGEGRGAVNAHREMVWFSLACLEEQRAP